ncbi:hypothetical protein ACTFIR_009444 [Dictyostelium discoideum]
MLALLMTYQALSYSRILQCKSRPPQPSFRDESQIVIQSNQELQLATEFLSATWYPMIRAQVPRHHRHMFPQVLGTSQEVFTQTISRVNTNPNSTTLEAGYYSTFQSHVMSIIRIQKSSTVELLMKSWKPSTLKVYRSIYTRFRNFYTLNSFSYIFVQESPPSLLLSNNVPIHIVKVMGRLEIKRHSR